MRDAIGDATMSKTIQDKGKTIVYDTSDTKDVRRKLIAGMSFDGLSHKERLIACEIARDESVRWNKSNSTRAERDKIVKQYAGTIKQIDALSPEKRAKIDALLNE
jgi:hypothetical protein